MAASTRISGKDLYITFAGTDISGDFTSVSISDEDDQIDVTAGSETTHYFISLARRTGSCDFEAFYEGTTTIWDAIAPGSAGTLIIAPKGTATGNPKWEWSRALVQNRDADMPFDDAMTVSASFQFSSLVSETAY